MLAVTAYGDTVNFDNETPGTLPPHWVGTQTGGGTAKWTVEKADDAPSKPNVLKQSGEATFPACIKDDTKVKDGFVEVKFKPVAGTPITTFAVPLRHIDPMGLWACSKDVPPLCHAHPIPCSRRDNSVPQERLRRRASAKLS